MFGKYSTYNVQHLYSLSISLSFYVFIYLYVTCPIPDDPISLYNVGVAYLSGIGVQQDMAKAKEYLEKASVLGFFPAQVSLLDVCVCACACVLCVRVCIG